MGLPFPATLSPSKIEAFTSCALTFRFSVIDRLPEPPSPAAVRGTLVHRALELLHLDPPETRTPDAAQAHLRNAVDELRSTPDWEGLGLDADGATAFIDAADQLVRRVFEMEDPTSVRSIGLELRLEAELDGLRIRGIIDRLELDSEGELVVTDYKTGRAPAERHERRRLSALQFYAVLCEQVLGRRPARIQLLYLGDGVTITAEPTDQAIRMLGTRVRAVATAVRRACATEDFRPKPGPLCDYCAFQAYCPAFGGDPSRARVELAPSPAAQLQLAG
jgi:putative RecB family exonuclease